MEENLQKITTIDEYISTFPVEAQEKLKELRVVINESAPEAKEKISWGMATFDFKGTLVHFACYKNHIGFYPEPSGINAFIDELSDYKLSKGTIQFPHKKPIPYDLVSEIVKFRVKENMDRKK